MKRATKIELKRPAEARVGGGTKANEESGQDQVRLRPQQAEDHALRGEAEGTSIKL